MEYTTYRLGDVCKIYGRIGFRGYTTKDLVDSPKEGAISLSPSNIVDSILDLSSCTYLSWKKYEESPEIQIEPNDIVIVKTGNSYGRTAIIRSVVHPMTLNPQFVVLKKCLINPIYLSYFIRTQEIQKQIYGIVGGSAIPTLSQEALANLQIRVPNDCIQSQIVDVLESLDRKISLNRKASEVLEKMAKQLYDYWFVQFDFPDENGKPYKSSGGKMVYNETLKREIPEGWEVKSINEWLQIKSGFPFKSNEYVENGKYKVVTIKNVQEGYLDSSSCDYMNFVPKQAKEWIRLKIDDRLISLTGNCGRLCFVAEDNLLLNQRVGLLCCDNLLKEYAYQFLSSSSIQALCSHLAKGAAQANLSPVELCKVETIMPSPKYASFFHEATNSIRKKIISNTRESLRLTSLRDFLLPMLMNGQVTIKDEQL